VERVTTDEAKEWRVRITRFPLDFFMFLTEESKREPGSTPGTYSGVLLKIPAGYPPGTRLVHWMFLPETCEFAIYTWNAAWERVEPNQAIPDHPIGIIRLEEMTEDVALRDRLLSEVSDAD
jgi:hypothetical protein